MGYGYPILKIPKATESQTDAAQYMIWNGVKQYNLCGEFCVAYCMQDEAHTDTIDDFLKYWEAKELKWWKTLFNSVRLARTTGIYDLEIMLKSYEANYIPWKSIPVKPEDFSSALVDYQLIVGVHIDHTGYLVGKGIPHWVVVEAVGVLDKNHAIVDVYNPYTNVLELYSWREFMTSTGSYKQGLWIQK